MKAPQIIQVSLRSDGKLPSKRHTEKTDNGPGEKWNQNRVSVCLSLILRESLKVTDGDRAAGSGDRNRQKGTWA